MHVIVKALLIGGLLVACGGKDTRYRDTELLERPPILAVEKSVVDETVVEPEVSQEHKKSHKKKGRGKTGLGDAVVLVEAKPMHIKLDLPIDKAWRDVGLGLEQSEIKITDHNQKRGLYYVYYTAKSIFGLFSRNKDEQHEANFMVAVQPDGDWVKITAISVNPSDDSDNDKNATSDQDALLLDLYEALHDHLKEE